MTSLCSDFGSHSHIPVTLLQGTRFRTLPPLVVHLNNRVIKMLAKIYANLCKTFKRESLGEALTKVTELTEVTHLQGKKIGSLREASDLAIIAKVRMILSATTKCLLTRIANIVRITYLEKKVLSNKGCPQQTLPCPGFSKHRKK